MAAPSNIPEEEEAGEEKESRVLEMIKQWKSDRHEWKQNVSITHDESWLNSAAWFNLSTSNETWDFQQTRDTCITKTVTGSLILV